MAKELTEVSEKFTEKSEIFTEREKDMTDVARAARLLEEIVEPLPRRRQDMFDQMADMVRRLTRFDLTPSRAEDIWREEARRIDAKEMDAFREAKWKAEQEKARADARQLADFYTRRAARLRQTDPELYCEEIARYEQAASVLGGVDRPGRDPLTGDGKG
ncbi:MAG: hypothetical protein GY788_04710 [bacterium]|nr:hypothetical protein [bacterium]